MTLEQALRLHALGLCIFPLNGKKPDDRVLSSDTTGAATWKPFQAERPTEADIRRWFGNGTRRNAAIACGRVSTVVAIDSDTPEAEAWCARHLPPTPMMTRTARGHHRYYRRPPALPEIPAFIHVRDDLRIEIRRDGHYVVAPGSIHPGKPEENIAPGHVYAEVEPWPDTLEALPVLPLDVVLEANEGNTARQPSEPLPRAVNQGGRNNLLFREGCRLRRFGWDEDEIAAALLKVNETRSRPPLDREEVNAIARSCSRYSPADDTFPLTDTGNAEFFAATAGDCVRYDHGRREWFVHDGNHWQRDRTAEIDRLALDAVRARQRAAIGNKERLKWAANSESRAHRDSLVRLARSIERIYVTGDDWDGSPWLIGVGNGVVDLRTGTVRHGVPEDYITKVAPVAFDPNAQCPRWDRFIKEIFADDPDVASYMQRVIGYSLTGITTEQVFWILWGNGSNGKSTLMETIMRYVLGDAYTWTMPFPAAGWSNAMSDYQKASLLGQRLVQANEVSRRGELNDELIKGLTGGDTVNARHPYGRPFTFVPVAKFFLRVNDKPVIHDQSHGMWRRVKLVPFTQTFAVDTTLADTLAAEAAGILAWAVRGCLDWQRDGLRHPNAVEAATRDYQSESDPLVLFLAQQCVLGPTVKVAAGALFKEYQRWCDEQLASDVDRMSQTAFGLRMKQRFQAKEEGRNKTMTYIGVGLRAPHETEMR